MEALLKYKWPILAVVAIILCVILWLILQQNEPTHVEYTSQTVAETTEGVQQAAANAGVKLDAGQVETARETIKEIRVTEREPVYIIQTTAQEAPVRIEEECEKADADFSIVTNADDPDEPADLSRLDEGQTVNLAQYNVQAFKKHINTIEYAPSEKVIGYTHQIKVTDSGRYVGIGADYDMDDHVLYAKISYSW